MGGPNGWNRSFLRNLRYAQMGTGGQHSIGLGQHDWFGHLSVAGRLGGLWPFGPGRLGTGFDGCHAAGGGLPSARNLASACARRALCLCTPGFW